MVRVGGSTNLSGSKNLYLIKDVLVSYDLEKVKKVIFIRKSVFFGHKIC